MTLARFITREREVLDAWRELGVTEPSPAQIAADIPMPLRSYYRYRTWAETEGAK